MGFFKTKPYGPRSKSRNTRKGEKRVFGLQHPFSTILFFFLLHFGLPAASKPKSRSSEIFFSETEKRRFYHVSLGIHEHQLLLALKASTDTFSNTLAKSISLSPSRSFTYNFDHHGTQ
jgi:hypothetical protein